MARVFSITAAATNLRVDGQGRAEASFTVSNTSGRTLRGRAEVRATDPGQQGWFSIVGDRERTYTAAATDQIQVRVAVPPGSPAGKASFRLDVVSAENPDEDFAEGPAVTVEVVATAPKKKGFPWWAVAAAVAVLVIGGVAGYFVFREKKPEAVSIPPVKIPTLVGMQLEEAKFALLRGQLKAGQVTGKLTEGGTAGVVLTQNPAAGNQVAPGSEVQLETALPGAKVPDVVGKPAEDAQKSIAGAGLRAGGPYIREAKTPDEDGKVQETKPAAGTLVVADSAVDLFVGLLVIKGAQVPMVTGLDRTEAEAKLTAASLTTGKVDFKVTEPGSGGKVLEQRPRPQDGVVPAGTKVDLVVAEAGVQVPNIVGSDLAGANAALQGAKLSAKEIARTLAEGKAQDTVLSQSPKAGELVKAGSAVEIGLADAGARVPAVVGFTREGAISALQGAKLQLKEEQRSLSDKPSGAITDQNPQPGSLVRVGTVVTIGVNALVRVPQVVGMTVDAANRILSGAKLTLGPQSVREVDNGVTGAILNQVPAEGNWVATGSAVRLETARVKPKPVGCDGVAGSGKVIDNCGVCGGVNACLRACPTQTVTLGNDYAFIYLDLPQTNVGVTYSWSDASVYNYHFPRCYRVAISSLRYSCNRTPNGGVWQQTGNVTRDANCFNTGNPNQPLMRVRR